MVYQIRTIILSAAVISFDLFVTIIIKMEDFARIFHFFV